MSAIPNLPDSISRSIYAELHTLLPPPTAGTRKSRELHEQRAATAVAHLLPENAAEVEVALQIVAAQAHAREALRGAVRAGLDVTGAAAGPHPAVRSQRADAVSMMRQADSGIRTLLRLQAERVKAETALRPAAMERAGYWFKSVTVTEPEPKSEPGPAGDPGPPQPRLEYGAMTPAERYATLYPDRASRILAERGLPARISFPPPDPAVVNDLLTSSSPLVRALYAPADAP